MYKIYDLDKMKLIKVADDEASVINKIAEYIQDNIGSRVVIYYNDEMYRVVATVGQFYDYVNDFNCRRLEDMSCMELKKEILGIEESKRKNEHRRIK